MFVKRVYNDDLIHSFIINSVKFFENNFFYEENFYDVQSKIFEVNKNLEKM